MTARLPKSLRRRTTSAPKADFSRLFSIGQAAQFLGVSIDTLRNWEDQGKITPKRSEGGIRRYSLTQLKKVPKTRGAIPTPSLSSWLSATGANSFIQDLSDSGVALSEVEVLPRMTNNKIATLSSVSRNDTEPESPSLEAITTYTPSHRITVILATLLIAAIAITTGYLVKPEQTKSIFGSKGLVAGSLDKNQEQQVLGVEAVSPLDTLYQLPAAILSPLNGLAENIIQVIRPDTAKNTDERLIQNEQAIADINNAQSAASSIISQLQDKVASLDFTPRPVASNEINTTGINLLRNSSFESNPSGQPDSWSYLDQSTAANTFVNNGSIRSGSLSLRIESKGGSTGYGIYQPYFLTKLSRPYTLSLYINNLSNISPTLKLSFWDKNNNQKILSQDLSLSSSGGWTRYSLTLNPSIDGTSGFEFYPMIEILGLTSGNVYLDDIALTEGQAISIYAQAGMILGDGSVVVDSNGNINPVSSSTGSLGMDGKRFGALYLSKASINSSGDANFSGTLTVGGSTTISGSANFTGGIGTSLTPVTNNTYALGSSTYRFSNLFLGGDAQIDGGDMTTTATTFNLLNATATTLNIGGAATTVSLGASTGTTTVNNDVTIAANKSIIPATTGSSDLGSSTYKFNNLYSNTINTATINTSGQGIFTYSPTSTAISEASVFINPTTATAGRALLGMSVGGVEKARITTDGYLGLNGANDPGSTYLINAGANFNVSTAGAVVAVGVNSGSGLIQGTGGLTLTGAASINASGSNATDIGTGTNSGTITIGNASTGDLALNDANWSVTGAGAATFASGTFNGNLDLTSDLVLNIGDAGTDFTAGGGLTLAELLTVNDDLDINLAAGENANIAASAASTADLLVITNSGQASATTGVDGLQITFGSSNASGNMIDLTPSYAGGVTDTLTYSVIDIDAFSPTNGAGTDTVLGISFGNLTDPGATIASKGILFGTGWDTDIDATTSLEIGIGGTNELALTATALAPSTDSGSDLGTSTSQFADLYLDGGNINLDNATDLDIDDNTASSLTISEGTNNYFAVTTTNTDTAVTLDLPVAGSSTTTGNLFTAAVNKTINLSDSASTNTIDIGGVTNSGTDTISIATEGTAADVIAIGNTNASTTLTLTGGDDWSVTATGVANFISVGATTAGTGAFTTLTSNSTTTIGNGSGVITGIGNSGGAAALNLTSGTGSQTFTSSVVSGTTTTSAFVFNASALTTGTAMYLTSTATSGKLLDLNATETSGTISNLAYGATKSLDGALTGVALDLSTNVTATGQNVTGQTISLPAVTNTGAGTYAYKGLTVSGGALVQSTLAGTNTWTGLDITMPNITQTTGAVTSTGLKITGGTVASGTSYGLIIDSNAGNVGIGTTGPGASLHVVSANVATNSMGNLFIQTSDAKAIDVGGQLSLGGKYDNTGNVKPFAGIAGRKEDAADSAAGSVIGYMALSTTVGGVLTEHMRIKSDGNVGIGTTAPTAHLQIDGNISAAAWTTDGIAFDSNAATYTDTSTAASGTVAVRTANSFGAPTFASTNAITVTDAFTLYVPKPIAGTNTTITRANSAYFEGNVGIGTTAPSQALDVTGSIAASSEVLVASGLTLQADAVKSNTNLYLDLDDNNDGTNNLYVRDGANATVFTLAESGATTFTGNINTNNQWLSGDGGAEGLMIDDSGNVGIGTTAPATILNVSGSDPSVRITDTRDTTKRAELYFYDGANANWAIGTDINYNGGGDLYFYNAGTKMLIDSTGNVGIGTTSPGSKLDVRATGDNADVTVAQLTNDDNPLTTEIGQSTSLIFNVMGTTNSGSSYGAATAAVLRAGKDSDFFGADATDWDSNLQFRLSKDGSSFEAMRITSTGNVGIGTTGPGQKLDVRGSAYVQDIIYLGRAAVEKHLIFRNNNPSVPGTDNAAWSLSIRGDIGGDNNDLKIVRFNNAGEYQDIPIQISQATGNIGIGTTNPAHKIDVVGTAGLSTGTAWTNTSDYRFKDIQGELTGSSLDKIMALRPISYTWNALHQSKFGADPGLNYGFIAQEVKEVIPEFVTQNNEGYFLYNPSGMEAILTAAIQEQQIQINDLIAGQENNLNLDSEGKLTVPEIKTDKLVISAGVDLEDVDVLSSLDSISESILGIQTEDATTSAQLADLEDKIASNSSALSDLQAQVASLSSWLSATGANSFIQDQSSATDSGVVATAPPQNDTELSLTPPELLLATSSATLANLAVTSEATISGQLTAYQATISDTFKSLGNSFLGNTTIAGDFSVDGTLSLTGNSLSSFSTLYIQNSALATLVDFFNGKVLIGKDGNVSVESLTVSTATIGSATIPSGQTETTIPNTNVTTNSKVFLTPTSDMEGTLVVSGQIPGSGFVVKTNKVSSQDITFNWWLVGTR